MNHQTHHLFPNADLSTDKDISTFASLMIAETVAGHFCGLRTYFEVEEYVTVLQAENERYRRFGTAGHVTYSIHYGAAVIGLCIFRGASDPEITELSMLLIEPKWRRRGIGRYVVSTFTSGFEAQGRRLQVCCRSASGQMMRLVKTLGFVEVDGIPGAGRRFLSS